MNVYKFPKTKKKIKVPTSDRIGQYEKNLIEYTLAQNIIPDGTSKLKICMKLLPSTKSNCIGPISKIDQTLISRLF